MKNDILEKKEKLKLTLNYGVVDFFLKLFKEEYDNYNVDRSLISWLISHLKEFKNNSVESGK